MAIEQEVIVQKLESEGLPSALATGVNIEDEDTLNSWIDAIKPEIPKSLSSYSREEIEEIAKDPQFKGAKGLQGYVDKLRQSLKKIETAPTPPVNPITPTSLELDEETKQQLKELREFKAEMVNEKARKELKDRLLSKSNELDQKSIDRIFKSLAIDATDEQIDNEVKSEKDYLISLGVKPSKGRSGSFDPRNSPAAKWAEKQKGKK